MFLETAKHAARAAGKLIRSRFEADITTEEKSSSFDIVTDVDRASEKLIKDYIMGSYPDHSFLGEEESYGDESALHSTLESASKQPYLWIVDPIDGTSNFAHGLPGFSVSIALACYGVLTVGVVYDPLRDILYWAEDGKGAWCGEKPISVSSNENIAECILSTGFSSDLRARKAVLASIQVFGEQCRTIRSFGSAALHLAYVASGKIAVHWQYGLSVWDIAAGVLLVQEAGGKVSSMSGKAYCLTDKDVLACNPELHSALLADLQPLAPPIQ
ncbi:inositol monophosphatase family protein [Paenibacillus ferrarius]|uniref:inositol monophosphatase family protein n=1 Tax=Paenibacillus ferrarius TaxID=1469647 RepID=UPI003D2CC0D3